MCPFQHLSNCWHEVVANNFFIILSVSVGLRMFPLSFLILVICIFSPFFLVILLKFHQLHRSFQRTNYQFPQFSCFVDFLKVDSSIVSDFELGNNFSQVNYSKIYRFSFNFNFFSLKMRNGINRKAVHIPDSTFIWIWRFQIPFSINWLSQWKKNWNISSCINFTTNLRHIQGQIIMGHSICSLINKSWLVMSWTWCCLCINSNIKVISRPLNALPFLKKD